MLWPGPHLCATVFPVYRDVADRAAMQGIQTGVEPASAGCCLLSTRPPAGRVAPCPLLMSKTHHQDLQTNVIYEVSHSMAFIALLQCVSADVV
jgi:hypothetical protein